MAVETPNLHLPLKLSGHVQMQQSVRRAFEILDDAVGGAGGGSAPDLSGVEPIATPDATDEATAVALVNDIKATLNGLITALKA